MVWLLAVTTFHIFLTQKEQFEPFCSKTKSFPNAGCSLGPRKPCFRWYQRAELFPSLPTPTVYGVKVLTAELAEMVVAGGMRGPRALPDLGSLSDELHSC